MKLSRTAYSRAHDRVRQIHGRARAYQCQQCPRGAVDWAYQHDDPNEKTDIHGRVYADNPDCYAPMCRRCHRDLDRRPSTTVADTRPRNPVKAKAARSANLKRKICECGKIAAPAPMGAHTKASGHIAADIDLI